MTLDPANPASTTADVAIIGGGAAGLMAALCARRANPAARVLLLDGARRLGAKILVSGGGRCNVTNAVVREADFWGGSRSIIGRVLSAFPAPRTVEFFRELGVSLHVEEHGKLFPDTNSARTVLHALLAEIQRRGVVVRTDSRVESVLRDGEQFVAATRTGAIRARRIILCTGGLSLPKTGSDGSGYRLAGALGHSLVPTTPALAPLVLGPGPHAELSGVSQEVELRLTAAGQRPQRIRGPMLWTHFGISGPAALDASRHWHRARVEGRTVILHASLLPGARLEDVDADWIALASAHPRLELPAAIALLAARRSLPAPPVRVTTVLLAHLGASPHQPLAHVTRQTRRRVLEACLAWRLPVLDSRGYRYAEVTAGGVPLTEVRPGTMESRCCPGLHLAGEILDADGRLGGFNFQWAWASGFVAGTAAANPSGG